MSRLLNCPTWKVARSADEGLLTLRWRYRGCAPRCAQPSADLGVRWGDRETRQASLASSRVSLMVPAS
jgi:hypothetical protein